MRCKPVFLLVFWGIALSGTLVCQNPDQSSGKPQAPAASDPVPHSDSPDAGEQPAPPLSQNESSSKQTRIDISPPRDDATKHPDSEDVTEMHAWNPHKAEKDIEIGEFYQKRKNYRAAEDRFREALEFKPGDAVATFRLAEVLEGQNQYSEAAKQYREYLKIPSNGKFSSEARKALARIEQKTSAR